MCEECKRLPATRIARIDDPGSKFCRHVCKSCGKDMVDTQRKRAGRGTKIVIQRLPLRIPVK